jgi:hypothetical protein
LAFFLHIRHFVKHISAFLRIFGICHPSSAAHPLNQMRHRDAEPDEAYQDQQH